MKRFTEESKKNRPCGIPQRKEDPDGLGTPTDSIDS
jgi:hypothetical protein